MKKLISKLIICFIIFIHTGMVYAVGYESITESGNRSSSVLFSNDEKGEGDESLRFVVFSDPHRHIDQVSACIEDIKENPDLPAPEFIFSTGDQGLHGHPGPDKNTIEYMMTAPEQQYGWNDLLLPYYVLWGNHDVTSYHAHPRDPYFVPYSRKDWGLSNAFYAFEYDNILFLVVSSGLGETRLLTQPQRDWLEQMTSMYPDKTTMIMTHRPLHNAGGATRGRAYAYFMDTYTWWKTFLENNPQVLTYGYGHTAMRKPLHAEKFGMHSIAHAMMAHGAPNTITYYEISKEGVQIKYWNGERDEWVVQYHDEPGYDENIINIQQPTSFELEGMDWFSYPHVFQDGEKLTWDNRMLAKDFKVQLIGEGKEHSELVWMNRKFNYYEPDEFECAARWIGYESDADNGASGSKKENAYYSEEGCITFNGRDVFAAATSTMQEEPPCTHERAHVPWSTTPWAVPGKPYKVQVKMKGEGLVEDAMSVRVKVLSRDNYARPIPDKPIEDPVMEEVVLNKVDLTDDYKWYEGSFTVPQNEDCFVIKTIWESHQDGQTCYLEQWSVTRADQTDEMTRDFVVTINGDVFQTEGVLKEGEVRTFSLEPTTVDNELEFKAHIGGSRVGMVRFIYDDPILWSDDASFGIKSKEDQGYKAHLKQVSHSPKDKISLTPLSPATEVEGVESINIRDNKRGWMLKEENLPGDFFISPIKGSVIEK